jgi:hypothetical protein
VRAYARKILLDQCTMWVYVPRDPIGDGFTVDRR